MSITEKIDSVTNIPPEYLKAVIEHIYRWQVDEVLADWKRVLKPGGKLVLEMPCLDKVLMIFNHYIENNQRVVPQFTMWGLYGSPAYKRSEMVHKWCWSVSEMTEMLTKLGFKDIKMRHAQTHKPERDFRAEAIK